MDNCALSLLKKYKVMIGACKTFLSHCVIDYLIIILLIRAFSNPSLIRAFGKKIALNEADITASPVSPGDGTMGYQNAAK